MTSEFSEPHGLGRVVTVVDRGFASDDNRA